MKRSLFFPVILGFIISGMISILFAEIGKHDFAAYWSASYLLLHGENPYDPGQMAAVQQSLENVYFEQNETVINAWNPPWLLIVLLPLAALPFDTAAFIWMWFNIALVGVCTSLCINLAGQPGTGRPFIWIFTACLFFGQTLLLLRVGQVSGLILIGIVAGIYCLRRASYAPAGALLVLATIKPHISYLALAWIGWWILRNRKWSVLVGAGLTVVLSIALTTLLFPDYLHSYFSLLQNMGVSKWYTSTLWGFLEALTGQPVFHWFGALLLPFVFLLQPAKDQSDWLAKLSLILVMSISLAPYGFTFDQVMLLPAIIQILSLDHGWQV